MGMYNVVGVKGTEDIILYNLAVRQKMIYRTPCAPSAIGPANTYGLLPIMLSRREIVSRAYLSSIVYTTVILSVG